MTRQKELRLTEFGKNLRRFRKLAGLTQIELSNALGYGPNSSAICQIEKGLKGMQQDKFMRLHDVIHVDPAALLGPVYTDEQAKMILEFFKIIVDTQNPLYTAFKAMLTK